MGFTPESGLSVKLAWPPTVARASTKRTSSPDTVGRTDRATPLDVSMPAYETAPPSTCAVAGASCAPLIEASPRPSFTPSSLVRVASVDNPPEVANWTLKAGRPGAADWAATDWAATDEGGAEKLGVVSLNAQSAAFGTPTGAL